MVSWKENEEENEPKVAKCRDNGQIRDTDMDLRVDSAIIGVLHLHNLKGNRIKHLEDLLRRIDDKVGQCGLGLGQVSVAHLQTLSVGLSQGSDQRTVHRLAVVVQILEQKPPEFGHDGAAGQLLGNPF